jgi:hypothetical protein
MADWVDGYHEIEVSYFEDEEGKGDYRGQAWMDEDTLHVEMSFKPPFPVQWIPQILLETDDG